MRDPLRLTSVTGVGESRFRVEVVDDDVLVLDVVERLIHRIPGADVDDLLAGRPAPSLGHLPEGSLEAVRASLAGRRVARRKVLMSGGALAAGGIVTLGLPFAAAAASRALNLSGSETELVAIRGTSVDTSLLRGNVIADGTVQVLLRATNGGDGGSSQSSTGGAGAYIAATIVNIPSTTSAINFAIGYGGYADDPTNSTPALYGGAGGNAPAVSWNGASPYPFLAVAGAGGGAGGGNDGGAFGQPGSGAAAGGGATTSAAGSAGVLQGGTQQRASYAGYGPNTTGMPGSLYSVSPSFSGGVAGSVADGRRLGGGGGAGYYQGGGGHGESAVGTGDGGGGGGGSTFFRTTNSGGVPYVSSSRVFPYGNTLAQGVDLIVYYNAAP